MEGVGIVVEYNPFHNGHKYHLSMAKKAGDVVIGVMSGDYVQRGEVALVNRWERAEMALKNGVDILVELPSFYSCQSAEIFAIGAIGILDILEVKHIVFGSESGDVKELLNLVEVGETSEFKEKLLENLKMGLSYPSAYSKSLKEINQNLELKSNDILGLEYIKAIKYWKSNINPIGLKREKVGFYEKIGIENIMSATGIRELIKNEKDFKDYIPEPSKEILDEIIKNKKITFLENYYYLIRYNIINNYDNLKNIQDMEIGYENKLYEMAYKYENFKDFFENIISKRMTIGRVQRILIHILINLTKDLTKEIKEEIPYVRVMGFSQKGREYLKRVKDDKRIITSMKNIKKTLSENNREKFEFNEKASLIYKMVNNYEDRKIPIMY